MTRLWSWAVALLARREAATPVALLRIAVGLILLVDLADGVARGAVGALWMPPEGGGIRALNEAHWLWGLLGGFSPEAAWAVVGTAMAGSLLLALGLGSRLAALVTLACVQGLFSLHPGTGGGHDRVLTNALWLLALSPAGETLSLRCRLKTGRWASSQPHPAWVRYVAIYQLALIYTMTGVQKVGADWWPWGGLRAVYYALLTPSWQRFSGLAWVGWVFPLTQIATVATVAWESTWFLVPLWLLYRDTRTRPGRLRALSNRLDLRRVYVMVGIGMHIGIWVTMNVGPFSPATMAFYCCLWHPDEYAAAWRRWRPGAQRALRGYRSQRRT